MIHFKNVDIRLNGFTLEGINFCVPKGAYAVLMGRTGCGKTTLLESACGLRPIAGGRVYLMDRNVTNMPPGKRNLGLVPQDGALFSTMTVAQNLGFALQVRKKPWTEIQGRVNELAGLLGIDHLLSRMPQGLSGGERQRVAIGRALAAKPDVLCLDEPLSALDEQTHTEMIKLLGRVHRETGVTVLHVTHNHREAKALGKLLLVFKNDKVIQDISGTSLNPG